MLTDDSMVGKGNMTVREANHKGAHVCAGSLQRGKICRDRENTTHQGLEKNRDGDGALRGWVITQLCDYTKCTELDTISGYGIGLHLNKRATKNKVQRCEL